MIPCLKNYIWGGEKLKSFNKSNDFDRIAESWTLSTNKNGISTIENGHYKNKMLSDVIDLHPKETVGEISLCDGGIPIIVKLIDANQNLSVQVHPASNDVSLDCDFRGKSELWYVIDCEPGSYIYCGFNKRTSKYEVKKRAKNGTICEILNKVFVKPGNSFYIPAKTIHALGAGLFVAEIQQNSDTTFRIFDYDRQDKHGKARQLHLEEALGVLNFDKTDISTLKHDVFTYFECEYFKISHVKLLEEKTFLCTGKNFTALLFLDGIGNIIYNGLKYEFRPGDCYFIPATLDSYSIDSSCEALLVNI